MNQTCHDALVWASQQIQIKEDGSAPQFSLCTMEIMILVLDINDRDGFTESGLETRKLVLTIATHHYVVRTPHLNKACLSCYLHSLGKVFGKPSTLAPQIPDERSDAALGLRTVLYKTCFC